MLEPLGCSWAGASEGAPKAQLDTRGSWNQWVAAWVPKLLFHFHHLHLNLHYANEVSFGQVLGVNRLFTKGRGRNVGSKLVQWPGGQKRWFSSCSTARCQGRMAGEPVSGHEPQTAKTVALGSGMADGRARERSISSIRV